MEYLSRTPISQSKIRTALKWMLVGMNMCQNPHMPVFVVADRTKMADPSDI